MKCTINDNKEITGFWDVDSAAPATALSCDVIHSIRSYIDDEGVLKFCYKLVDGVTTPTADGEIYIAQEYARKRKAKYDALNQFELISDDSINGTTTHKDAIVAIKAEFPKP